MGITALGMNANEVIPTFKCTLSTSEESFDRGLFERCSKMLYRRKPQITGLLFILPAVLLAGAFFYVPLVRVIQMSMYDWPVLGAKVFVGSRNYVMIIHDEEFWISLFNTVIYTVIVTPLIFIPAFGLAILVNKRLKGATSFRSIYFLPVTISFVVASYIWTWMYHDFYGIINYILLRLHVIDQPIVWLGTTWLARLAVSIMIGWKTTGFTMLILLAGLQGIPQYLYEAASIDGARSWQKHRFITLPLLRSTLALALVLSVVGSFQAFDHFYVMTGGGPLKTTQTFVMYLRKMSFEYFKLGRGAAASIFFLILLFIISAVELKLGRFGEKE